MKIGIFVIKLGVLNNIYKMIDVYLHKDIIMNQFHIHNLYNWFFFKAQINLMQIFKEFKLSEILP
jgi:hypothetical protein